MQWVISLGVTPRAMAGDVFSLPTIVEEMIDNYESWEAVRIFCDKCMSQKEATQRKREDSSRLKSVAGVLGAEEIRMRSSSLP
ncbi:hypothetical protein EVAR_71743_1 [Eumeta japonica]|uniref:Uncharacterized protein n=1 Tax=Eumeta variegata TaxID=151549 RepID=A0A4C1S9N8_EUMVA|nr:hypothetical protein EVAR_71743_1 [Eumeta japonica]